MSYELLIKNAVLRGADNALTQVGIRGDKIVAVGAQLGGEAERVIDAEGGLVTESFVNGHLHLCKVYTLARMDEAAMQAYTDGSMGGAMTGIELAAKVKRITTRAGSSRTCARRSIWR